MQPEYQADPMRLIQRLRDLVGALHLECLAREDIIRQLQEQLSRMQPATEGPE